MLALLALETTSWRQRSSVPRYLGTEAGLRRTRLAGSNIGTALVHGLGRAGQLLDGLDDRGRYVLLLLVDLPRPREISVK